MSKEQLFVISQGLRPVGQQLKWSHMVYSTYKKENCYPAEAPQCYHMMWTFKARKGPKTQS